MSMDVGLFGVRDLTILGGSSLPSSPNLYFKKKYEFVLFEGLFINKYIFIFTYICVYVGTDICNLLI